MRHIYFRFSILSVAHIAGAFFGLFSTMIIVRQLGPEGFGFVALGLSVQGYAWVLGNLGTDLYSVQITAKDPSGFNRNLANAIYVRVLAGLPVCAFILAVASTGIWEEEVSKIVAVFGLSVFINAFYPLWAPQALEKVGVVAICKMMVPAFNFGFVVVGALLGAGPFEFALAKLGADTLVALGLMIWVYRTTGGIDWSFKSKELIALAKHSLPIGGSQVLRSLGIGSDIIVLSVLVSSAEVGFYSAAFRIFTLSLSIATLYFIIMLPIFSRKVNEGLPALADTLHSTNKQIFVLAGVGSLVGVALSEFGLTLLFGETFRASTTILQVLFLALFINIMQRSYRQVLISVGARRTEFRCSLAGTSVNLTSKIVLIPIVGTIGAAIGTVLGEATMFVLQRRAAHRELAKDDTLG